MKHLKGTLNAENLEDIREFRRLGSIVSVKDKWNSKMRLG